MQLVAHSGICHALPGVHKTEIQVSAVAVDCAPAGTSAGGGDVGGESLREVDLVPGVLSTTD